MTYKKDGRWVKMHKGRLYEVSRKSGGGSGSVGSPNSMDFIP